MATGGYVYLICDPLKDWFKVGVTTGAIEKRIKQLQTGNGAELFIRDYFYSSMPFKLEKLLHARFTTKRVHNEWFQLDMQDVVGFKDTCQELEHTAKMLYESDFFEKFPVGLDILDN